VGEGLSETRGGLRAELELELNQIGDASDLSDGLINSATNMKMSYELGKGRYFKGLAYLKARDFVDAIGELQTSLKIFKKEKNDLWIGLVKISLGEARIGLNRIKSGLHLLQEAIKSFAYCRDFRRKTDAELSLIKGLIIAGQEDKAISKGRILLKRRLLSYQQIRLNELLGEAFYKKGNYQAALKHYLQSVEIVENVLNNMTTDEIRYFYAADKYRIYNRAIECMIALNRINDSAKLNFQALQITNLKSGRIKNISKNIPKSLLEQRDNLRAQISKLSKITDQGFRSAQSSGDLCRLEQELWRSDRRIRDYGKTAEMKKTNKRTVKFSKSALRSDELLVNYILLGDKIGAFCISKRTSEYIELPLKAKQLTLLLQKLNFLSEKVVYGFGRSDSASVTIDNILSELYLGLIDPLESQISDKKLIVLSDGQFMQTPFYILLDKNKNRLGLSRDLSIIVNPIDLANRLKDKSGLRKKRSSVFASGVNELPLIYAETDKLKEIYPKSKVYRNGAANRTEFQAEIGKDKGFIHIAAHAARSSENPLFSKILLDDGPIFPFDIFGLNLNLELVTLSGCQTAAPGLYYGNSFSLAKTFYQAGSRFVLASLWPVSDRFSLSFMVTFYNELSISDDIKAAYKEAMTQASSLTDNPAFWGSFILLGI